MRVYRFSNQNGGGTGEVAGEKWLVGSAVLRSARLRGIVVSPPVGEEGWVQLRDSKTVDDDETLIFCEVQATKDNPSNSYNFVGKGFPIKKGLYLRKPNNSTVYIYVD